jgi:hypothetical protein
MVFPHKIDTGNPITNFSVTNLQSIAAAIEVKVFPRPILSATIISKQNFRPGGMAPSQWVRSVR